MFSKNGITYSPIQDSEGILNKLPPKVYSVELHPISGFYLEYKLNSFKLPENIYSFNNTNVNANLPELFIKQYEAQDTNLGVSLTGVKGTGKSLLMKQIANLGLEKGYPVITVENSFDSAGLASFLESIEDDCIILFDEFEKNYVTNNSSANSQNGLLSLLDGTSNTHDLFVITSNHTEQLSDFLVNRPSRIRYSIEYTGLTPEFMHEYLKEHLNDTSVLEKVEEYLFDLDEVNFDLLNTVKDEVNSLYPSESIESIVQLLNVEFILDDYINYNIKLVNDKGELIATRQRHEIYVPGIHMNECTIGFGGFDLEIDDDDNRQYLININSDTVKSIRGRTILEFNGKVTAQKKDRTAEPEYFNGKAILIRNKVNYRAF